MTEEVNTREVLMSIASGALPFSELTIGTETCAVCGVVVGAGQRERHTRFHVELTQLARVAITLMNIEARKQLNRAKEGRRARG